MWSLRRVAEETKASIPASPIRFTPRCKTFRLLEGGTRGQRLDAGIPDVVIRQGKFSKMIQVGRRGQGLYTSISDAVVRQIECSQTAQGQRGGQCQDTSIGDGILVQGKRGQPTQVGGACQRSQTIIADPATCQTQESKTTHLRRRRDGLAALGPYTVVETAIQGGEPAKPWVLARASIPSTVMKLLWRASHSRPVKRAVVNTSTASSPRSLPLRSSLFRQVPSGESATALTPFRRIPVLASRSVFRRLEKKMTKAAVVLGNRGGSPKG